MTDEELNKIIEEMKEFFLELPHPVHEPVRFAYYVKLFKYYRGLNA